MPPLLNFLNDIFLDPTEEKIKKCFSPDGYIRFNMIHINPIILKDFKNTLMDLGMINWHLQENGLVFQFNDFIVEFRGHLTIYFSTVKEFQIFRPNKQIRDGPIAANQKEDIKQSPLIYCLELDFEPVMTSSHNDILQEIESYLKSADSIFFMTYNINTDFEILNKDLSKSIDSMARKIAEKRKYSNE